MAVGKIIEFNKEGAASVSLSTIETLEYLLRLARSGDIIGMTYIATNYCDAINVDSIGVHAQDKNRAIGLLYRAANALAQAS